MFECVAHCKRKAYNSMTNNKSNATNEIKQFREESQKEVLTH